MSGNSENSRAHSAAGHGQRTKLIIVFPDHWLSYSPTLINLASRASRFGEVHVIGVDESKYLVDTFDEKDSITVHFITPTSNSRLHRTFRRAERIINRIVLAMPGASSSPKLHEFFSEGTVDRFVRYRRLRRLVERMSKRGDVLIAVDNVGVLAATSLGRRVHAVSLEIGKNAFYYMIDWSLVQSVMTQTPERKGYWVPKARGEIPTFFVQNAPPFSGESGFVAPKAWRRRIIYMGYLAIEYNALDRLIESLYLLPNEYQLTLKGPRNDGAERLLVAKFSELYAAGRFVFDHEYVANDQLQEYLSQFSVGATFYDLNSLPYDNFNVASCPSGKLFNYFNAGIPVVGNNILGLRVVEEFRTGILIDDISARSISEAVVRLEQRYLEYSTNARRAAKTMDFNERAEPFLRHAITAPS